MLEQALHWVAAARSWATPIRWLIGSIAREWLHKRTGVIVAPGFHFYPTRDILERQSDYKTFLGEITDDGYGIFITGRKLWINQIPNASRLKKIILPDPRTKSFQSLAASVREHDDLNRVVCRATKHLAEDYKIEIFWYPEAVHASVVLRDPDLQHGSVHIETVLPFTIANMRPSMTIFRTHNENLVRDAWSSFKKMLEKSYKPDCDYINKTIGES